MKQISIHRQNLDYSLSEAYKSLRTNLLFCGEDKKVIAITSCTPNEGKSTVSVRLWKLLAEAGFPTVLVDVDLRKSEIQRKYRIEGIKEGLNHFLSGLAEYEDVV